MLSFHVNTDLCFTKCNPAQKKRQLGLSRKEVRGKRETPSWLSAKTESKTPPISSAALQGQSTSLAPETEPKRMGAPATSQEPLLLRTTLYSTNIQTSQESNLARRELTWWEFTNQTCDNGFQVRQFFGQMQVRDIMIQGEELTTEVTHVWGSLNYFT